MGEKDDKNPKVKINTSADDVRMFELECQIEKQRKSLCPEASKENLNTGNRQWAKASNDLNKILLKSSSDLQKHSYAKRGYTDMRSQTVKKRAISTGRSGKHFSVSKRRQAASGRTSQTDFIQRNRETLSNFKPANSSSRRFIRI